MKFHFRPHQNSSSNPDFADVYFFCKDGRILPALGQQTFAMIEIECPNLIRLHNASREVSCSVGDTLNEAGWLRNINGEGDCNRKEPKALKYNVLQYCCSKLKGNDQYSPWQTTRRQQQRSINLPFQNERSSKEVEEEQQLEVANAHLLVGKLLLAMNKQGLNLYATTRLTCSTSKGAHRSQLIFRQSNVGYSQSLCLNLSGKNIDRIINTTNTYLPNVLNPLNTGYLLKNITKSIFFTIQATIGYFYLVEMSKKLM